MSLLVLIISGLNDLKFKHLSSNPVSRVDTEFSSTYLFFLYSQFFFSAKSLLKVRGLPKKYYLGHAGSHFKVTFVYEAPESLRDAHWNRRCSTAPSAEVLLLHWTEVSAAFSSQAVCIA